MVSREVGAHVGSSAHVEGSGSAYLGGTDGKQMLGTGADVMQDAGMVLSADVVPSEVMTLKPPVGGSEGRQVRSVVTGGVAGAASYPAAHCSGKRCFRVDGDDAGNMNRNMIRTNTHTEVDG